MSVFSQTKNLAIVVGQAVSGPFTTEEFQRGSFICTAVVTSTINFDVSEDGTNWDTLSNADAAFTSLAAPAANMPRALPAALFKFRYARFHITSNQTTADAAITVRMLAN